MLRSRGHQNSGKCYPSGKTGNEAQKMGSTLRIEGSTGKTSVPCSRLLSQEVLLMELHAISRHLGSIRES